MSHQKYRVIAICLLCVAVSLTGFKPLPVFAQADDEAAIRRLVENFFAAYQKEDIEGLMSLWSEHSGDLAASRQSLQQTFSDYRNIEVKKLDIGKVAVEADKAKLQLTFEMSAVNTKTGKPADDFGKLSRIMQVVREGAGWKVWRYVSVEEDFAADLLAAKNEEERKMLLSRNAERVTGGLVRELNKQGRTLSSQSKFAQALSVYHIGLSVAAGLDDKTGAALILIGVGNVHYLQGDYTQALDSFRQSLKLAEEAASKVSMARALSSIGTVYYAQGDYPQALELQLKSLKLREELGDKAGISTSLGNIAGVYYLQGSYEQALEYQLRGLKLAEEMGDKPGIAVALSNIGAVYLIQGDYLRSLDMRQKSLKMREELDDKPGMAYALNSIGLVYYEYGDYPQALEFYQRSLQLSTAIGIKALTAAAFTNIGNVHYAEGTYAQAIEFYQKGLKLHEELGDKTSIATSLNNLGSVYNEQGNHTRALESLQQSLKLAEELGYEHVIASSLTNIAQTYQVLGAYKTALDYAGRAIAVTRQSDNAAVLWQALTAAGKAQMALNQDDLARQSFLDAIAIIEKLRGQIAGGERGQQRFFESKVSPYYAMIDLLIKQQETAQALLYAERAKGRVLLDVLSNGRVNITKAMTAEELARDRTLTAELNNLNTQISRLKSGSAPAELSGLTARLEKARLEYEAFQASLYAAHPELQVQRGQAHTLTLEEAAKLLPDDRTALLEYVVGDNNSYLFVITKAAGGAEPVTLKVYPLNLKAQELTELSENFRQRVAERDLTVKAPAQRLYDLLIKSAEKQLQGIRKLVIVPDGPLWELPFQALYRGQKGYLLEDYAVSYAPSLSVLREMDRKGAEFRLARRGEQPSAARKMATEPSLNGNFLPELLALGNPVLNKETVAKIYSLRQDASLSPLPSAEREVNTLGELYGRSRSKVLIGDKATEEEVKAEAGKYLLLHFATHAILDDRNPMYSHIMLSYAGDNAREDGLLEAWELMKLDLTAEMVVLSACQTARGRVGAGEGMIGMSWALFVAGCPTAVVSQWKVDSARTTDLMLEFHQNLRRRKSGNEPAMTKAEALREAALKLLHSPYNHPAYWAGFVLIGNEK
ncbi:MAG TPA: CHAT domain-containing protein [Pyrinomonadaceae bacterium]|jgi:CHAT domain-containing protein/tetratricopeptide (TPR) repeat protein